MWSTMKLRVEGLEGQPRAIRSIGVGDGESLGLGVTIASVSASFDLLPPKSCAAADDDAS